jgi:hypothetical protein
MTVEYFGKLVIGNTARAVSRIQPAGEIGNIDHPNVGSPRRANRQSRQQ